MSKWWQHFHFGEYIVHICLSNMLKFWAYTSPSLCLFLCNVTCLSISLSLSLHCPSVFSGNWKLDQPAWSHCFFCPGSFSGQHLIPDTSCSPTAWLIWPCQMATDHKFWRHLLWINWTLSRSKVPLINPICLCKVHIPPTGQHCDPVQNKNQLWYECHKHQTFVIRTEV